MSIEAQLSVGLDRKYEAQLRATFLIGYYQKEVARVQLLMKSFGQKEVAGGHAEHPHTIWCELEIEKFTDRIVELGGILDPDAKCPENMIYPLSHSEGATKHQESNQMKMALTKLAQLTEIGFKKVTPEMREQMWNDNMLPTNPDFRHAIIVDRGNNENPVLLRANNHELHPELRTVAIEHFGDTMCWTTSGYTGREVMVVDNHNALAPWWTTRSECSKSATINIETYTVSEKNIVNVNQRQYSLLTGNDCRVLSKEL